MESRGSEEVMGDPAHPVLVSEAEGLGLGGGIGLARDRDGVPRDTDLQALEQIRRGQR